MTYDQFLLRVGSTGQIEAEWIQEVRPGDQRTKGNTKGQLNLEDALTEHVSYFVNKLRNKQLEDDALAFRLLGKDMYRILFPDSVGKLFEKALGEIRASSATPRTLRLWISVDPACPSVSSWPLEFLCCPSLGEEWLGTSKGVALSRRFAFPYDNNYTEEPPPLRVLVVVSKPTDLGGVITKVVEEIAKWAKAEESTTEAQARLPASRARSTPPVPMHRPLISVKVIGELEDYEEVPGVDILRQRATFNNIGQVVEDWKPQVVHFIGHGKVDGGVGGSLGLVEDAGTADWADADEIRDMFRVSPQLVVLQACESAMASSTEGFMSLASRLLERNVPAIVAMQFDIDNASATGFATGFYRALTDGLHVDAAVQSGRWKIAVGLGLRWKQRDFGTPVLFMVSPLAMLVNPESSRGERRAGRIGLAAAEGTTLGDGSLAS